MTKKETLLCTNSTRHWRVKLSARWKIHFYHFGSGAQMQGSSLRLCDFSVGSGSDMHGGIFLCVMTWVLFSSWTISAKSERRIYFCNRKSSSDKWPFKNLLTNMRSSRAVVSSIMFLSNMNVKKERASLMYPRQAVLFCQIVLIFSSLFLHSASLVALSKCFTSYMKICTMEGHSNVCVDAVTLSVQTRRNRGKKCFCYEAVETIFLLEVWISCRYR